MTSVLGLSLVVIAVFGVCMLGIAVGSMFGRPVKGSCGGIAANGMVTRGGGDETCSICGGDPNKCEADEEPQHYSKLQQALQKNRLM